MTAREWLEQQNQNAEVTFIRAEAHKDHNSPFYSYLYHSFPIRSALEWLKYPAFGKQDIVINPDHPPIDSTGIWGRAYKEGQLKCAMIVNIDDMRKMYPDEKQYRRMIEYYNKTAE